MQKILSVHFSLKEKRSGQFLLCQAERDDPFQEFDDHWLETKHE